MRITRSTLVRYCASLAIVAATAISAVPDSFGQGPAKQAEAAMQLSLLSFDNSNPAVAFSPDGEQLFVAWDGLVEGNRRIMLRERVAGEWLPPVIVDANPAGNNKYPTISVDKTGTPHLAWISLVDGKRIPIYARRTTRFPNAWIQQEVPFPPESTTQGGSDFVNLQLDSEDRPWLVWQYGFGNVFSIACTHFSDSGELVTAELTPGANTHNLYPELFFMPEPTVYWYLAQEDQFFLIGSSLDRSTGRWEVSLPENLENLPADNLPDLFRSTGGSLAAIWYDRQKVENPAEASDRIYVGVQNEETKGRGEVVDEQPGAGNHSVSGTAPAQQFVTAWVSETYEGGANIYLGTGDSPGNFATLKMSERSDGICSNPKVAGTLEKAAVTWEEKAFSGAPSSEIMVRVADL